MSRAVKSSPIIMSCGGKGILEVKICSSDSNGQEETEKSKTGISGCGGGGL